MRWSASWRDLPSRPHRGREYIELRSSNRTVQPSGAEHPALIPHRALPRRNATAQTARRHVGLPLRGRRRVVRHRDRERCGWQALVETLGCPQWMSDARFETPAGRKPILTPIEAELAQENPRLRGRSAGRPAAGARRRERRGGPAVTSWKIASSRRRAIGAGVGSLAEMRSHMSMCAHLAGMTSDPAPIAARLELGDLP